MRATFCALRISTVSTRRGTDRHEALDQNLRRKSITAEPSIASQISLFYRSPGMPTPLPSSANEPGQPERQLRP